MSLSHPGSLLLAIASAFGAAAIVPVFRSRGPNRWATAAAWCLVPAVFACPWLIPADDVASRAASAVISTDLALKMVDFFRQWGRLPPGEAVREYFRLLVPLPVFAVLYPDLKKRLRRPENPWPQVAKVVGGLAGTCFGAVSLVVLSKNETLRAYPVLDHVVKIVLFVPTIESISAMANGLERLAGFDVPPMLRHPFASRTVGEFWARYNVRVHGWLVRHVFRPLGGRRRRPGRSG